MTCKWLITWGCRKMGLILTTEPSPANSLSFKHPLVNYHEAWKSRVGSNEISFAQITPPKKRTTTWPTISPFHASPKKITTWLHHTTTTPQPSTTIPATFTCHHLHCQGAEFCWVSTPSTGGKGSMGWDADDACMTLSARLSLRWWKGWWVLKPPLNVYIYVYIYIPRTQMALVLNGKGLVLGGWPSKIGVIWVLGMYISTTPQR